MSIIELRLVSLMDNSSINLTIAITMGSSDFVILKFRQKYTKLSDKSVQKSVEAYIRTIDYKFNRILCNSTPY